MIEGSCHCGKVRLAVETAPEQVTDCNCSVCRRYGVLWAYYRPDQVTIDAETPTALYEWDERSLAFHRCAACGCVTHWSASDADYLRMGINMRLFAPQVLAAARVHHHDGASAGNFTR